MVEGVIMLFGGCAALLGVSGVSGRGSTVLVLVLALALVPSTCCLVSSVLWGLRRPLEFGRRLYPCAMIGCVSQEYERCSEGELGGALDGMRLFDSNHVCLVSWLKYTRSDLTLICVNR
jgi:hypothetical protein